MKFKPAQLAAKARPLPGKTAGAARAFSRQVTLTLPELRERAARGWERLRDRPAGKRSLRLRLCIFFALFLSVAWLVAALFAWRECSEYIDEFFDTQQMLFAKRLATADFASRTGQLPKTRQLLPGGKKERGEQEEDAIAFAVFNTQGRMLLHDGDKGGDFVFQSGARGFTNTRLNGKDDWRIVWLHSQNDKDGSYVIAVGQELEYRRDMALDLLGEQITPWLVLLPVLLAGLFLLLSRELAPLRGVATQLRARSPKDASLLETTDLPSEVRPLAQALNSLFVRTNDMLDRERAFISDAAHELRTPLAGLRVQAEVAGQDDIDPQTRHAALANLRLGIDRSTRLVEQLLALSRLEAMGGKSEASTPGAFPLDWPALLREAVAEFRPRADKKDIRIQLELESGINTAGGTGEAGLVAMLLRNLFNNAVLYTPEGGEIIARLQENSLTVANSGPGLPAAQAARLGERFYRPPGQQETGSGLGLSIVRRIAELHGFELELRAKTDQDPAELSGFSVTVSW